LTRKLKRDFDEFSKSSAIVDDITVLVKSSCDSTVNSNELLFCLSQNAEQDHFDRNTAYQIYKKIIHKINETNDAIVKVSYISMIKELIKKYVYVIDLIGINIVVDDFMSIINNQSSQIVIAEVLNTLHLFDSLEIASEQRQKIIKCAKTLLQNHVNHLVKNECLLLLSDFAPIQQDVLQNGELSVGQIQSECIAIIKLLRDSSHYHDSRVRSTSLACIVSFIVNLNDFFRLNFIYFQLRLHKRGVKLDISLYSEFCEALADDYEGTRLTAVQLLQVLSHNYGDWLVVILLY